MKGNTCKIVRNFVFLFNDQFCSNSHLSNRCEKLYFSSIFRDNFVRVKLKITKHKPALPAPIIEIISL